LIDKKKIVSLNNIWNRIKSCKRHLNSKHSKSFLIKVRRKLMLLSKSSTHTATPSYCSFILLLYAYKYICCCYFSVFLSTTKNSKISCLGNFLFHWLLSIFYAGITEKEDEEHACVLYLTTSRNRSFTRFFFLFFKRTTSIIKRQINQERILFPPFSIKINYLFE
jgi:hypothetical protein